MRVDEPSQLIKDVLYSMDHRLLDDPEGESITRIVRAGVAGEDVDIQKFLRDRVHSHKMDQLFAGPFHLPETGGGDLWLGDDVRGRPVHIPAQVLGSHMFTLGTTGSGKTTLSLHLATQIARLVSGMLLIDLRKREYRKLVPWLAASGVCLLVVPARALRFNPLQVPEGVDPFHWAARISDLLIIVLRLPSRASKLLHVNLLTLYERFGMFAGRENYPTLFDLREGVAHDPKANPQARAAVLDALDPVLLSLHGVLRYRRGWAVCDLLRFRIVLELDSVGEVEKDLILSTLLLSEFTARIARGVSNRPMNVWIACDEAARLVSTAQRGNGLGDLIGLVRGAGVGLSFGTQTADIAAAVLSNTATKFLGQCGSATDYDTFAATMGLTAEQRRALPHTLSAGVFLVHLALAEWRHPFLLRVPWTDFSESPRQPTGSTLLLGDATRGSSLEPLLRLPVEEATEFRDWRPGGLSHSGGITLSEGEQSFLRAVIDNPGLPSSKYAKLAGVGTHQSLAIRKRLIALGLLREARVNTSARGRTAIVLEPLSTETN
jgi:hypothetical protein